MSRCRCWLQESTTGIANGLNNTFRNTNAMTFGDSSIQFLVVFHDSTINDIARMFVDESTTATQDINRLKVNDILWFLWMLSVDINLSFVLDIFIARIVARL